MKITREICDGIPVIFCDLKGFNIFVATTLFENGAKTESIKEYGINHFIEHLSFLNTPKYKDCLKDLKYGLQSGYTTMDYVVYEIETTTSFYKSCIKDLLDITFNNIESVPKKAFDSEKKVVISEIETYSSEEDVICYGEYYVSGIGKNRLITGTKNDIIKYDLDFVVDYVKEHKFNKSLYSIFIIFDSKELSKDKILSEIENNIQKINFKTDNYNSKIILTEPDSHCEIIETELIKNFFNISKYIRIPGSSFEEYPLLSAILCERLFHHFRNLGLCYGCDFYGSRTIKESYNLIFNIKCENKYMNQIDQIYFDYKNKTNSPIEKREYEESKNKYLLELFSSQMNLNHIFSNIIKLHFLNKNKFEKMLFDFDGNYTKYKVSQVNSIDFENIYQKHMEFLNMEEYDVLTKGKDNR